MGLAMTSLDIGLWALDYFQILGLKTKKGRGKYSPSLFSSASYFFQTFFSRTEPVG